MNDTKKKVVIFDLDGTLYPFNGGSYESSGLRKQVLRNVIIYIENKLKISSEAAKNILNDIVGKYREEISIGLEKEFGFDRYEYFNTVWDIDPKPIIILPKDLRKDLLEAKENHEILLLSDAPQVWIKNVLSYLDILDLFEGKIFSGEGAVRKSFSNALENIIAKFNLKAEEFIMIGDQEETDILPAKTAGMKTIFINSEHKSRHADFSVENISKALRIINSN